MIKPNKPLDEQDRINALLELNLLDTKPEERFDKLTREVTEKLNVPISTISLIDKDREWFKSNVCYPAQQGDRDMSFCGHAILHRGIFIVEDTLKDERFYDNPAVVGAPFIRFYAGITLYNKKRNQPVGVFCVKDTKPKKMNMVEIDTLLGLATKAEEEINKNQ